MSAIAGAMLVGGIVSIIVGIFVKKIRLLFPPVITGTVVFTIGLSLYSTAINYMAGGTGNTAEVVSAMCLPESLVYGSWQNWLVAALTLTAVMVLNNHGKGICKLASILLEWCSAMWWPCASAWSVSLMWGTLHGSLCPGFCTSELPSTPPAVSQWDCCSPSTPFRPSVILPPLRWGV